MIAHRPFAEPLEGLAMTHLLGLIEAEVPEGWFVEYKADVSSKSVLFEEVAAFANSSGGGTVILGIEEENLLPVSIRGLDSSEWGQERVVQVIRNNISPVVGNTEGDWHINWFRIERQPDPIYGVLLGDIVHNLRSALDHLVWQLVIKNRKLPGKTNQFPILDTPEEWGQIIRREKASNRGRAEAPEEVA